MSFLGVGWQEVFLIGVLMLVVVGPERMPVVAYQIGRAVRTLQSYARAVRDEFSEEIGYLEEQVKTVRGEVDQAKGALRDQQRQLQSEMREATAPLQEFGAVANEANNVVRMADWSPSPAPTTSDNLALAAFASPAPEPPQAEPGSQPAPLVF